MSTSIVIPVKVPVGQAVSQMNNVRRKMDEMGLATRSLGRDFLRGAVVGGLLGGSLSQLAHSMFQNTNAGRALTSTIQELIETMLKPFTPYIVQFLNWLGGDSLFAKASRWLIYLAAFAALAGGLASILRYASTSIGNLIRIGSAVLQMATSFNKVWRTITGSRNALRGLVTALQQFSRVQLGIAGLIGQIRALGLVIEAWAQAMRGNWTLAREALRSAVGTMRISLRLLREALTRSNIGLIQTTGSVRPLASAFNTLRSVVLNVQNRISIGMAKAGSAVVNFANRVDAWIPKVLKLFQNFNRNLTAFDVAVSQPLLRAGTHIKNFAVRSITWLNQTASAMTSLRTVTRTFGQSTSLISWSTKVGNAFARLAVRAAPMLRVLQFVAKWTGILNVVEFIVWQSAIIFGLDEIRRYIEGPYIAAWNKIPAHTRGPLEETYGFVDALTNFLLDSTVGMLFGMVFSWDHAKAQVAESWAELAPFFESLLNGIASITTRITNFMIEKMESAINFIGNGINFLIGIINKIASIEIQWSTFSLPGLGSFSIPKLGFGSGPPAIQEFAPVSLPRVSAPPRIEITVNAPGVADTEGFKRKLQELLEDPDLRRRMLA